MLKVKTVPFEIRTENGVLPEQRFVGLHTLMCHAEREKTLSRASVMPVAVVLAVQHLKNIKKLILFNMCECLFFLYLLAKKTCNCPVLLNAQHFCIVIRLPTLRLALCLTVLSVPK